eukprot:3252251-Pleurochrysis_carterae.AAC.4
MDYDVDSEHQTDRLVRNSPLLCAPGVHPEIHLSAHLGRPQSWSRSSVSTLLRRSDWNMLQCDYVFRTVTTRRDTVHRNRIAVRHRGQVNRWIISSNAAAGVLNAYDNAVSNRCGKYEALRLAPARGGNM